MLTRCFLTKRLYSGKSKGYNPVHADMASHGTLWITCHNGGVFSHEKRKLREGKLEPEGPTWA